MADFSFTPHEKDRLHCPRLLLSSLLLLPAVNIPGKRLRRFMKACTKATVKMRMAAQNTTTMPSQRHMVKLTLTQRLPLMLLKRKLKQRTN
jgi:hypothetical protein